MTEQTALTLPQRAAVALNSSSIEVELHAMVTQSADLVEILNPAAREQIHRAAMNLKGMRVNIEKTGKEARDDATKFSKAVIQEEARLVAIIAPEEKRLLVVRDEWDARIEAEKEAKRVAEQERVDAIRQRIADFGKLVTTAAGKNSDVIKSLLLMARNMQITDAEYAEFIPKANTAKDEAIAALEVAYKAAYDAEQAAEAARIQREEEDRQRAAQAAENARVKAELEAQAAAQAAEAKRIADEQAAAQKRLDEAAAAQRAEIERQQREAQAKIAEAAAAEEVRQKAAAAAHAAEMKRQADELAAQQAAFARQQAEAKARDEEEQKAKEDAARLEADHAEALQMNAERGASIKIASVIPIQQGEVQGYEDLSYDSGAIADALIAESLDIPDTEPTDEEIVTAYVEAFGRSMAQAIERLRKFSL